MKLTGLYTAMKAKEGEKLFQSEGHKETKSHTWSQIKSWTRKEREKGKAGLVRLFDSLILARNDITGIMERNSNGA